MSQVRSTKIRCVILLHPLSFLLQIRLIIKISKNPCYPINVAWFSLGWSKKKFKMADSKKTSFSSSANSQYFFMKISWIGPWVSRIGWCKWHWFGSTYMVVRLSNICSKTGLKCIFCVFRLFLSLCRTVSQPYRLSQTNAVRINQSY